MADNAITVQTDLDTVTTLGDYYKAATTFYVTNGPTGIDSNPLSTFRLTVLKGPGANDIIQEITASDGKSYKRGYDGSNWSTWIEFSSAATVAGIDTRLTTAETDIDNLEASRLKTYASDSSAWDTAPTANSTKPVTSGGVKTETDKKLPTYANDSTVWDTTPTASSNKPVTSGGVKTELDKKLPTYANDSTAWDTAPTASSNKPVTSGGVKTQIDSINGNKANQAVIATRQANLTAVKRYEIGEQFIYNNTLYKATAVIANNGTITIGGNATTADNVTSQISKSWQTVVTTSNQYIAGGEIWYSKMGSVVVVHGAIILSKIIPISAVIATGFPKPYRNANIPVFVMSINPYNHIASIDANGNLTNTNLVDWGGANEMWWNIFATYVCQ